MKVKLAVIGITILLSVFGLQNALFAQTDQPIEEVLEGFDTPREPDNTLPEIMDGFEDTPPAGAETDLTEEEKILKGFDTEDASADHDVFEERPIATAFSVDGYIKLSSVYAYIPHEARATDTRWQGLTRLSSELKLIVDANLPANWQVRTSGHVFYDAAYSINDREDYTDEVLDHYEKEIEIDEFYVQGRLSKNLDLKAGRQIVVWGRSDNIRITDVLNPLDLRWPGLVDIEKLRLPTTMTKLDCYYQQWSLTGIVVHEVRTNKNPEFGSDFFPGTQPLPDEQSPDEGFSMINSQFAASLSGIFSGWDVSFYFADVYDPNGHLSPVSLDPTPQFEIKHSRLKMVGGAFNVAWHNWLYKAETAHFDGFEFYNTPEKTYSRIDGLAGVEYTGVSDATIAVEFAGRHFNDFDAQLEKSPDHQEENLFEWALRMTKPFLNDTLNLTLAATSFGLEGDDGGFQRFTAEYDVTDAIELTGGVILYQSGGLQRTRHIGDNDRVYFEIQYNF
jgi:hypothetical protein